MGYQSPSIIEYLEPLTGDLFTARYADCIFNEDHFPAVGGDSKYQNECQEINWNLQDIPASDPRTLETEFQVQKIIDLQHIANNLPDAFTDIKGVTKSLNPTRNVPARGEIPKNTTSIPIQNKRGRPKNTSQDKASNKQPRKQKNKISETVNANQPHVDRHQTVNQNNVDGQHLQPSSVVHLNTDTRTSEYPDSIVMGNHEESIGIREISTNYSETGISYDRKTTVVDTFFSKQIAHDLHNDPDPKTLVECRKCPDWTQWKNAIQSELDPLTKGKVFTLAIPTPPSIFHVGYKWIFNRKWNENNEVVRYKARLVAQGFIQRPSIDFNETYFPVISRITFRFLISLAVKNHLSVQLMDVVAAYLYGSLDSDIYMKIPDGIPIPNPNANRNIYCVKIQKSLYGLKQSGRMWYNRLNEFLLQKGYTTNDDSPCVFIKKSQTGFCIISVYVNDINEAHNHLMTKFEMKDLGQTKFSLGLQLEHIPSGIFVYQAAYIHKILEKFNMDKAHPTKTPMIVRSLDLNKDSFRPHDEGEGILGPEVPYLSAIGVLMYLANSTRPDIAFAVNLLARHSAIPTK
jgi:hypothetical protein